LTLIFTTDEYEGEKDNIEGEEELGGEEELEL
jgi:hypothetical protein